MIRRKLTRLEVTLEDTKELDDLFSKPAQLGLAAVAVATGVSTTAPSTAITSKLASNLYQKQLLLLGKQYENSNQNTNTSDQIGTTSSSANQDQTPTLETNEAHILYNPQPYNPNTRFQFNQESQQLR